MSNLVKVLIATGCNNNRNSLLRLCYNAAHVRNVCHLSKRMFHKTIRIRKETFDHFVNIRACGYQTTVENIQPQAETLVPNETRNSELSENAFFYKVLQEAFPNSNTLYQKSKFNVVVTDEEALNILNKNWSNATAEELVNAFRLLSYNILYNVSKNNPCIDKSNYNHIFNGLNNKIKTLDDTSLEEILKCLVTFKKHTDVEIKLTLDQLDKKCEESYKNWSIDKMLLFTDILYNLNFIYYSSFIWKFMRKMNNKLNKLTHKNLLQLLFLVNILRKTPLNMYEVEIRLHENLNYFTINELGSIAMAYFKSKSKIRNPEFTKAIINRLICEMNEVHSICIAALVKLIRFSMHYSELSHLRLLLKNIAPSCEKFNIMCLMHIIHASSVAQVYEKPLIDIIIKRSYNEMKNFRIKDIEKLTFFLSTFDIDSEFPIYDKLIEEINVRLFTNKDEIERYPKALMHTLYYLILKDIYVVELIKEIMQPSYMKLIHRGNVYNRALLLYSFIEHSLQIEKPEYDGPRLNEGIHRILMKMHWKDMDKNGPSRMTKFINEVIYSLKETFRGNLDFYTGRLLPHFSCNNIVIGVDQNHELISTHSILSNLSDFAPKKIDDTFPKNVKWFVFLIIDYKHTIKGTNECTGLVKTKIRQLSRLGYTPILLFNECFHHQEALKNATYIMKLIEQA